MRCRGEDRREGRAPSPAPQLSRRRRLAAPLAQQDGSEQARGAGPHRQPQAARQGALQGQKGAAQRHAGCHQGNLLNCQCTGFQVHGEGNRLNGLAAIRGQDVQPAGQGKQQSRGRDGAQVGVREGGKPWGGSGANNRQAALADTAGAALAEWAALCDVWCAPAALTLPSGRAEKLRPRSMLPPASR